MKTLFLTLLFTVNSFAIVLISDLDDTIKVTHVKNPIQAARNALSSTKAFAPMPELFSEMRHYLDKTYIVTASPKILASQFEKFYKANNLDITDTFARNFRDFGNKKEFKFKAIKKIIKRSNQNAILIGDNSELDAEVYQMVKQEIPEHILEMYIHRTYTEDIPKGFISFFTAFDIAANEYLKKRMTFTQVKNIAQKIITEKNMSEVIPKFAYCPIQSSEFNKIPMSKISALAIAVKTKIIGYCKLRKRFIHAQ